MCVNVHVMAHKPDDWEMYLSQQVDIHGGRKHLLSVTIRCGMPANPKNHQTDDMYISSFHPVAQDNMYALMFAANENRPPVQKPSEVTELPGGSGPFDIPAPRAEQFQCLGDILKAFWGYHFYHNALHQERAELKALLKETSILDRLSAEARARRSRMRAIDRELAAYDRALRNVERDVSDQIRQIHIDRSSPAADREVPRLK